VALFTLPHAIVLFVAPKSPRWLFSNNKTEEGKEVSKLRYRCCQPCLFFREAWITLLNTKWFCKYCYVNKLSFAFSQWHRNSKYTTWIKVLRFRHVNIHTVLTFKGSETPFWWVLVVVSRDTIQCILWRNLCACVTSPWYMIRETRFNLFAKYKVIFNNLCVAKTVQVVKTFSAWKTSLITSFLRQRDVNKSI